MRINVAKKDISIIINSLEMYRDNQYERLGKYNEWVDKIDWLVDKFYKIEEKIK